MASVDRENEQLRAEIEELRRKLASYEGAKAIEPETESQKRERVHQIFSQFDTDNSGDLDVREFQVLVFQLGEAFTEQQSADAVASIDTDKNGTISFEEFYTWWSSITRSAAGPASEQLDALKLKLQSKSYMKSVSRLLRVVDQKAGTQLRASTERLRSSAGNAASTPSTVDDNSSKLDISFQVGDLPASLPRKAFRIFLETNPAKAAERRAALGLSEATIAASLYLKVKEGVEDFELGELAGIIKTALSFLAEVAPVTYKLTVEAGPAGQKYLVISVTGTDPQVLIASQMLAAAELQRAAIDLEFAHDAAGGPQGRFAIYAATGSGGAEFIKSVLPAAGPGGFRPGRFNPLAGAQAATSVYGHLKEITFRVRFGSLAEALQQVHAGGHIRLPLDLNDLGNDQKFRELILLPGLRQARANPRGKLPPAVWDFYSQAQTKLTGIDKLTLTFGEVVGGITLEGLDIFTLLPPLAELGQ